jgi:uncharacterized protein (DUF427 family)
MSIQAIWNNQILAESNETVQLEGNYYFPSESIKKEFFENSDHHSTCPYKGEASYQTLVVNGERSKDAAWYYPHPKKGYEKITNRLAFWKGVEVIEV